MANVNTVWNTKKEEKKGDKKHEMFTSQGGQSNTGVLRPVKGPNKQKALDDPDYLNKMMNEQQNQGMKSENKFKDAIYIYRNGYKIGNGPFMDVSENEENKKFLSELNAGYVPKGLESTLKEQFGDNAAAMAVDIVNKKEEDYKPPVPDPKKFQAFKGAAHSMKDVTKSIQISHDFDTVNAAKIQCNDSNPNSRIQIILIGGKKETIKVNLTSTILQIYGHVKAVSGYDGKFQLLAGFPPKALSNPSATVADEKLQGARITQKKV